MNWFTKKILYKKLTQYFKNIQQNDIELNIIAKQNFAKLHNLELKTEILNNQSSIFEVKQCKVGNLEIAFDLSKLSEQPLNMIIKDLNISIRINQNVKETEKVSQVPKQIEYFRKLITDKNDIKEISKQISHIKQWIIEILTNKLNFQLENIVFCIQYKQDQQIQYLGMSIQKIDIKTTVIQNQNKIQFKTIKFQNTGFFIGFQKQVNILNKLNQRKNKEIFKKQKQIQKFYFVKDLTILFTLNLIDKKIQINIPKLTIDASIVIIKEIYQFFQYTNPLLKQMIIPRFRPKQGKLFQFNFQGKKKLVSQGTIKWWQHLGNKILNKINEYMQFNLFNKKFRDYAYCLIHTYIYHTKQELILRTIKEFEKKRSGIQLVRVNIYILKKLRQIKLNKKNQLLELFINQTKKFQKRKQFNLRVLKYEDIVNNKNFFNIHNSEVYLKHLEDQSIFQFEVNVEVKNINFKLRQNNIDIPLKELIQKIESYKKLKGENLEQYQLGSLIMSQIKWILNKKKQEQIMNIMNNNHNHNDVSIILELLLDKFQVTKKVGKQVQIKIQDLRLYDCNKMCFYKTVLQVDKVMVAKFSKLNQLIFLEQKEYREQLRKNDNENLNIIINEINLNLTKIFFERMNFIFKLITFNLQNYKKEDILIYQPTAIELSLEASYYFRPRNQSNLNVQLKKINIFIPLDYNIKNDILVIQINQLDFHYEANKNNLDIKNTKLLFVNCYQWKQDHYTRALKSSNKKANIIQEDCILNLDRIQFLQKINQNFFRRDSAEHYQNSLTPIYFLIQLIIPLIFIKVSLKQLFYLKYLGKIWTENIFSNYIIPTTHIKKSKRAEKVSKSQNINQKINKEKWYPKKKSKLFNISIFGIIIELCKKKHKVMEYVQKQSIEEILLRIFLQNLEMRFCENILSKTFEVSIRDIFVENISNHIPIIRQNFQKFIKNLLSKSDYISKSHIEPNPFSLDQNISKIEVNDQQNLQQINISFQDQDNILYEIFSPNKQNDRNTNQNEKIYASNKYVQNKLIVFTLQKQLKKNEEFKQSNYSFRMTNEKNFNEKKKYVENTKITITPIQILFQMQFFKNLLITLEFSNIYSSKKYQSEIQFMYHYNFIPKLIFQPNKEIYSNQYHQSQEELEIKKDKDLLICTDYSKTITQINLSKLNFLIFYKDQVCYTISLNKINIVKDKLQFSDNTRINLNSLYIVDTSHHAGDHQIIFKVEQEHKGLFLIEMKTFTNDFLMDLYKYKTLLKIKIERSEVIFLKKKVKELVNCLKYVLSGVSSQNKNDKQSQKQMEQNNQRKNNRFLYKLVIHKTKVKIPQNSLSTNDFTAEIEELQLKNYEQVDERIQTQKIQQQSSKYEKSIDIISNNKQQKNEFSMCSQLKEQFQFQSFKKQKDEESQSKQINIKLTKVNIYDKSYQTKILIPDGEVIIKLIDHTQIKVEITDVDVLIDQNNYELLIRITQQNLGQLPDIFEDEPLPLNPSQINIISLQNLVNIDKIKFRIYNRLPQYVKQILLISKLKIVMNNFTNNAKYIELLIEQIQASDKKVFLKIQSDQKLQKTIKYQQIIKEIIKNRKNYFEEICAAYRLNQNSNNQEKLSMFSNEFFQDENANEIIPQKNYVKLLNYFKNIFCYCCKKKEIQEQKVIEQKKMKQSQMIKEIKNQISAQLSSIQKNISYLQPDNEDLITSFKNIKRKTFKFNINQFQNNISQDRLNSIRIEVHGTPTFQKYTKIFVSNVQLYIDKEKSIMSIINFFKKPYTRLSDEVKNHYRYNNFAPSQLSVNLNDTKIIIGKVYQEQQKNSFEIHLNLSYDTINQGDTRVGPGIYNMFINSEISLKFKKFENDDYKTFNLCEKLNLHINQQNKIPYNKNNSEQISTSIQQIYICGSNVNNKITIQIPLTYMKTLIATITSTLATTQEQVKKVNEEQQKLQNQIPVAAIQQEKKLSYSLRKIYSPGIMLSLSRGKKSLINAQFNHLYVKQTIKNQVRNKMEFYFTMCSNYLNLVKDHYQPFIQPWKCNIKKQSQTEQTDQRYKKTKEKISLKSLKTNEQKNGFLNINFSTNFVITMLEAKNRYQEIYKVQEDGFLDLTKNYPQNRFCNENQQNQIIKQYRINKNLYKNNFGKNFIEINQKLNRGNTDKKKDIYWNLDLKKFITIHSFFDHKEGRKNTHIRSPYRIKNRLDKDIYLFFKNKGGQWMKSFSKQDFYYVPIEIYNSDYLVNISTTKNLQLEQRNYTSILYLLSEYEKKTNFTEFSENSTLYERIYKIRTDKVKRFIKKQDFLFRLPKQVIVGCCIKSQYEKLNLTTNQIEKYYETCIELIPPIIIKNELPLDIFVQLFKSAEDIKPLIRIQIEKFKEITFSNFQEDFQEFYIRFVIFDLGCDKLQIFKKLKNDQDDTQTFSFEFADEVGINIRIEKLSQLSRFIKLYSNYIIYNQTNQIFEIREQDNKLLKIQENEMILLSRKAEKKEKSNYVYVNFVNKSYEQNAFIKIGVSQTSQVFTLQKKLLEIKQKKNDQLLRNKFESKKLIRLDIENSKQEQRTCFNTQNKVNQNLHLYEFVLSISQHTNKITKVISIFYRYYIKNNSNRDLYIFHSDIELFKMHKRKQMKQSEFIPLYSYHSNKSGFRIGFQSLHQRNQVYYSQAFKVDRIRQFIVKIKKQPSILKSESSAHPYKKNYLFYVTIMQQNDIYFITITEKENDFPLHLENATPFPARIMEGDQDFMINSGDKIPFFWCNLDNTKSNELYIQVEGRSKIFNMNQMSQYEPLLLDEMNVHKNRLNKKKQSFQKGYILINYKEYIGKFNVICDILGQKLIISDNNNEVLEEIDLKNASYINNDITKIYIYLNKNQFFSLTPHPDEFNQWKQALNSSLSEKYRIIVTMQSDSHSRIIKLHGMRGQQIQTLALTQYEFKLQDISLALINSKPQQLILIGLQGVEFKYNFELKLSTKDEFIFKQNQVGIKLKRIKINNNMLLTVNPVALAHVKKGNSPYFQFKSMKKLYLNSQRGKDRNHFLRVIEQENKKNNFAKTNHFNKIYVFLNETEIYVDTSLVAEMLKFKGELEKIQQIYQVKEKIEVYQLISLVSIEQSISQQNSKRLYINDIQIYPVKLTISINLKIKSKDQLKLNAVALFRAIPFGIQNAIIQLNSFSSHHISMSIRLLIEKLKRSYLQNIKFQILKNAGSYELLAPFTIINGIGQGARNIFYDPIQELYKKKQIKAFASKVLEGILKFITYIFQFIYKLFDIFVLSLLAVLTLDIEYNQRRNRFKKISIKNPKHGLIHGGKNYISLIQEFIKGFYIKPRQYFKRFNVFGIFIGLFVAVLSALKLIVGLLDWIVAIVVGVVNMGDYQPDAMDVRTRPVRIFKNMIISQFHYYEALGYQIMRKNNIELVNNQTIKYAEQLIINGKSEYFIISNDRFIHSKENLSAYFLKYYQIKSLKQNRQQNKLILELNIPIIETYYLFNRQISRLEIAFENNEQMETIHRQLNLYIPQGIYSLTQNNLIT